MIHYEGSWGVVTGASSGLGRGLAARLADRGMSLVLTGRNASRLDEVARQIREAAPRVTVETVIADLSTRPGVSALLEHVGARPIEVLVNNAGFGSYGPFTELDPTREADEVYVDVNAVIALARAYLPGMLARRSGGILNVASTIAFQPAPYQAVYAASKALVLSFSQGVTGGSAGRDHRAQPGTRRGAPAHPAHGVVSQAVGRGGASAVARDRRGDDSGRGHRGPARVFGRALSVRGAATASCCSRTTRPTASA